MSDEQLRQDIEFLAGRLPHRGANTENERAAADYIYSRFRSHAAVCEIEDFYSIDTPVYLFASYYLEFTFVSLLTLWFPWVALGYGSVVFLLYMCEITGYTVMSRFLPQYETQNVAARYLSDDPEQLLIITANYDSPKSTPLSNSSMHRWLPYVRRAIVLCMLTVLVTCASQALGFLEGAAVPFDAIAQWIAALALAGCAAARFFAGRRSEFTRGAANNASGVAVLLDIAKSFEDEPPKTTDVWLIATGAKENLLGGARYLLEGLELDPAKTFFLNIAHVGGGTLHFATGEGAMHVFSASSELVEIAERGAKEFGASPIKYRWASTDALVPLARGFRTMSIIATDAKGVPLRLHAESDRAGDIDYTLVGNAAGFAKFIAHELDRST